MNNELATAERLINAIHSANEYIEAYSKFNESVDNLKKYLEQNETEETIKQFGQIKELLSDDILCAMNSRNDQRRDYSLVCLRRYQAQLSAMCVKRRDLFSNEKIIAALLIRDSN